MRKYSKKSFKPYQTVLKMECKKCSTIFYTETPQAKFCCDNCKKYYSKEQNKLRLKENADLEISIQKEFPTLTLISNTIKACMDIHTNPKFQPLVMKK